MDDFDTLITGAAPRLAQRTPGLTGALHQLVGESEVLARRRRPRWPVLAAGLIGIVAVGGGATAVARVTEAPQQGPSWIWAQPAAERPRADPDGPVTFELTACEPGTEKPGTVPLRGVRRVESGKPEPRDRHHIVRGGSCGHWQECFIEIKIDAPVNVRDLTCQAAKP